MFFPTFAATLLAVFGLCSSVLACNPGEYVCGSVCGECNSHGCRCPDEQSAIYTCDGSGNQQLVSIFGAPGHCSVVDGAPFCL